MKIAQHQVQKIMALVAQHKNNVPQFLDLLNAVVKVEELDLPLKRNQGFVMTYFMQFRSDVAFVIDQDEKARYSLLEFIYLLLFFLIQFYVPFKIISAHLRQANR